MFETFLLTVMMLSLFAVAVLSAFVAGTLFAVAFGLPEIALGSVAAVGVGVYMAADTFFAD